MFPKSIRWAVALAVALATPILGCGAKPTELICQTGYTLCSGKCVELSANPRNCGACGNACEPGKACQEGVCGDSCPSGFTMCGGECVKVKSDDLHCGACGQACGEGQSCSNGACVDACPPGQKYCSGRCVSTHEAECGCVANLLSAIPDSWGAMWDGMERKAANLANARGACEAIGGRLPTATELYRVSVNQSGEVGQSYTTNPLWSLVPVDPTNQITVTLHNGVAAQSLAANESPYRCICPATTPAYFAERACHGTPGKECFNIPSGGKAGRYNVDSADRVALPKGAALWECGFLHAHLPEFATLVEAIREGLPNGTKQFLHTADDLQNSHGVVLMWSGKATQWQAIPSDQSTEYTVGREPFISFKPFRCVGINYSPRLPSVTREHWIDSRTGNMGDESDRNVDYAEKNQSFAMAHDFCWKRGGHLARTAELASLIQGGLPNGSGTWLWTADQASFERSNGNTDDPCFGNAEMCLHRVGSVNWRSAALGPQHAFGYYAESPGFTGWLAKGYRDRTQPFGDPLPNPFKYPFRCIHYPLDEQFVSPNSSNVCAGGCVELRPPGIASTVWMDRGDRSSATAADAILACAKLGGHLPLERDYVEAIRLGLPPTDGSFRMTSDLSTDYGSRRPHYQMVKWSTTSFDDQFDNNDAVQSGSNRGRLEVPRAYRCMWTNELR